MARESHTPQAELQLIRDPLHRPLVVARTADRGVLEAFKDAVLAEARDRYLDLAELDDYHAEVEAIEYVKLRRALDLMLPDQGGGSKDAGRS